MITEITFEEMNALNNVLDNSYEEKLEEYLGWCIVNDIPFTLGKKGELLSDPDPECEFYHYFIANKFVCKQLNMYNAENMPKYHYPINRFFQKFGHFLKQVNFSDDTETGWWRLMAHEKERVEDYMRGGLQVATIWEGENEDENDSGETVTLEYEASREHPYVTGYFILDASINNINK